MLICPIHKLGDRGNCQGVEMTATKTCSRCKVEQQIDVFTKDRRRPDGRNPYCRSCKTEMARAYRAANADKVRAKSQAYYQANKERIQAHHRDYYKNNRDEHLERTRAYYKANRQRLNARDRNRYQNNKERYMQAWNRRRARKACAVPQRWQIHDIVPFCCYWCGANLRAYGATTHVDHVMPIALGGPANQSNEVMSCSACNMAKSAKHPLVWIAELVDG